MARKPSNKRTAANKTGGQQKLRIIGGKWRGRKLNFPDIPGLRPTPDRVRETLFNWLQPHIAGAHCLDLFCGSGALGLEALSRDAASVTFVDSSRDAIQQMRENLQLLDSQQGQCIQSTAQNWLQSSTPAQAADLIFLDPPFRQGLLEAVCDLLVDGRLKPGALVYIEVEKELRPLPVPVHWQLLKEKTTGQLTSYLYKTAETL